MINLCLLLKHPNSIHCSPCGKNLSPAMALSKWQFLCNDDPWKVSAFVSAIMELILSILLLLGAAISFFTSRIVKFFGLEPPCTCIRCSHPLHSPDEGNQERYSLGLKDHTVMESGVDGLTAHLGCGADHQCYSSDSLLHKRQIRRKHPRHRVFAHAYSNCKLNEDNSKLLSARSSSESNGEFDAEDQCEILQVSADSEQEGKCGEVGMRDEDLSDQDTVFVDQSEAFEGRKLIDDANKVHDAGGKKAYNAESSLERLYETGSMVDVCSREHFSVNQIEAFEGHKLVEDPNKAHESEGKQAHNAELSLERLNETGSMIDVCLREHSYVNQSEAFEEHELVEDANKVHDSEGKQGYNAESSVQSFNETGGMVDVCSREHSNVIRSEAVEGHQCVEDASKVHDSEGIHEYNAESSLECLDETGSMGDVCSRDQSNFNLLALDENHCCIQFGSISVRTWIKDGTTNNTYVDSGGLDNRGLVDIVAHGGGSSQGTGGNECSKDNRGLVDIVTHGGGSLQGTGGNEYSKDKDMLQSETMTSTFMIQSLKDKESSDDGDCLGKGLVATPLVSLQLSKQNMKGETCLESANAYCLKDRIFLESNQGELLVEDLSVLGVEDMFGDAIATKKSLDKPTPRIAVDGLCPPMQEKGLSTPPLEGDEVKEETIVEDEQEEGLHTLKMALQAERSILATLETDLENERNAAAVATSEAMAMISRLQEEKSAMQMEVAQLQRMSEERADYDEHAMAVLKEILFKRETENMALEKEVELYREKFLAGEVSELNGVWFKEATGNLARQLRRRKPIQLSGEEVEFWSPLGPINQQQSLTSLDNNFYQIGNRGAPQRELNIELEELSTVSLYQNSNKRSRDSPANDKAVAAPSVPWDDGGRHLDFIEGSLYGLHDTYQRGKETGRFSSSTDEDTLSARERLWVLETELQELQGKEELKREKLCTIQADEGQHLAFTSAKKRGPSSLTESLGAQSKCGISEDGGDVDGGCGTFVPIHDVYEVHAASTRNLPCTDERPSLEVIDGVSRNKELQPRMSRHITEILPRFAQAAKPVVSEEIPSTPTSMIQSAGWEMEKSLYPEDFCQRHDLHSQSLVLRRMELEEIQQLAVRLKALEEDRDLLRETVDSFKHRDAELTLLQEISQHLQELRMAYFTGFSGNVVSEETSVTSPSRSRALKKRRYSSSSSNSSERAKEL